MLGTMARTDYLATLVREGSEACQGWMASLVILGMLVALVFEAVQALWGSRGDGDPLGLVDHGDNQVCLAAMDLVDQEEKRVQMVAPANQDRQGLLEQGGRWECRGDEGRQERQAGREAGVHTGSQDRLAKLDYRVSQGNQEALDPLGLLD